MIERAIEILQNTGFDFTARELAEIFWLAVHLDEVKQQTPQEKPQEEPKQQTPQEKPQEEPKQQTPQEKPQEEPKQQTPQEKPQEEPKQDSNKKRQSQKVSITHSQPRQKGVSIKVPAAPAIRNALELRRALRPLMRKVPSPTEKILDEEATVYRIAEQDIWVPVFQPQPQKWLELALVVEKSNSTAVWKPTIRELEKLLKYHGAFRDVRTWELKVTPTVSELFPLKLSSQSSSNQNNTRDDNSTSYSPDILIDPKGQRLILLVSDCISTAWRNKFIHPVLTLWGNKGLLTTLQLLPEQLWERTALSSETPVQLSSLKPGVPNSQLIAKNWDEDDIEDCIFEKNNGENSTLIESISMPIIILEPQPLLTWSRVIAGFGNITTAGFKFSLHINSNSKPLPELENGTSPTSEKNTFQTPPQLSADALVNRFRATASPTARRLAGLMAAAPVSLPVVQLIQKTLLPNSRQIHAAEVFMSGLLKSTTPQNTQADYIEYEFIPGVRELLVDSVPKSKTISVIDEVSEYIAQRLCLSVREFEAQLLLPLSGDNNLATKIRPFAKIKAQVLRRLGGKYADMAQELEQISQEEAEVEPTVTPWDSKLANFLPVLIFISPPIIEGESENAALLLDLVKEAAKDIYEVKPLQEPIFDSLEEASMVIAYPGDESWNPDISLKVGYRMGVKKHLILLTLEDTNLGQQIPFDAGQLPLDGVSSNLRLPNSCCYAAILPSWDDLKQIPAYKQTIIAKLRELLKQQVKPKKINSSYAVAEIFIDLNREHDEPEILRNSIFTMSSDRTNELFHVAGSLVGVPLEAALSNIKELIEPNQREYFYQEQHQLLGKLIRGKSDILATIPLIFKNSAPVSEDLRGKGFLTLITEYTFEKHSLLLKMLYYEVPKQLEKVPDGDYYICETSKFRIAKSM
ncbi:MAG: SAV_2336 N-terminal domain-related protein [Xenococcus sp. MO_188.B8]|nr:SAV_2336 N-terminal domain-related protein [Xenococcus sp. MO_188.B8]